MSIEETSPKMMDRTTKRRSGDAEDHIGFSTGDIGTVAGFSISLHHSPDAFAAEWLDLEREAVTTVFQSVAWVSSWCRQAAFGLGETPVLVAGRDSAGHLAFVLPFSIAHRLHTRVLCWLGVAHASYGFGVYRRDVVQRLDRATLREVLACVAAACPGVTACLLEKQPREWEGIPNPFLALGDVAYPVAVTAFELSRDFDVLYAKVASAKKRSETRRLLNQLQKTATVQIGIAATPAERHAAFHAFQEQKSRQLGQQDRPNPFVAQPIAAFYEDLLSAETAATGFEIGLMRVNDAIVAVDMVVRFQDRCYGLNRSIAEGDVRKYSPGRLVNNMMVERACKADCRVFDLGPGDAAYKTDWGGQPVSLFATCVSLRTRGIAASAGYVAMRRLHAYLKSNEAVWSRIETLRSRVRSRTAKSPAAQP